MSRSAPPAFMQLRHNNKGLRIVVACVDGVAIGVSAGAEEDGCMQSSPIAIPAELDDHAPALIPTVAVPIRHQIFGVKADLVVPSIQQCTRVDNSCILILVNVQEVIAHGARLRDCD